MRLAMATLADAANVREGMISVLSAGASELWRRDFPAPFGAVVVLLVEVAASDDVRELDVEARMMRRAEDGTEEGVASMTGKLRLNQMGAPFTNAPAILGWGNTRLESPGEYYIRVTVGGRIWTDIPFMVNQLPRGE